MERAEGIRRQTPEASEHSLLTHITNHPYGIGASLPPPAIRHQQKCGGFALRIMTLPVTPLVYGYHREGGSDYG